MRKIEWWFRDVVPFQVSELDGQNSIQRGNIALEITGGSNFTLSWISHYSLNKIKSIYSLAVVFNHHNLYSKARFPKFNVLCIDLSHMWRTAVTAFRFMNSSEHKTDSYWICQLLTLLLTLNSLNDYLPWYSSIFQFQRYCFKIYLVRYSDVDIKT